MLAPDLELGQRGVERDRELQRRLARARVVEVAAGAQRELLAGQGGVATAEQRGEPLLGERIRERALAEGRPGSSRAASQTPSATCSPVP